MRIRKVIAGIGLTVGLSGAGVVAAVPQLVMGSGATAGLPTVCIDGKFCEPGGPLPTD
jgi:hypothetical protein